MRAAPGDVDAAIAAHGFYALGTPLRALGPRVLDRRATLRKRPTACATSAAM